MAEWQVDNPRAASLANIGSADNPEVVAIALGLIYIGDRLEAIRRELWNANNAKGIYRDRAGE